MYFEFPRYYIYIYMYIHNFCVTLESCFQEIGSIDDAKTCQKICNELYPNTCTWFMFDRTTSDCRLFKGSLTELENDCREKGYPINPDYDECNTVLLTNTDEDCSVSKR